MFWSILNFALFFAVLCVVGLGVVRSLPQPRRAAAVYLLGAALFIGGLLNFLVFWHVAVYIGGDAVGGKIENGKFFVSSHGTFTEVSEATWHYSYAHAVSTWITHPLGAVGWLLMYLAHRQRKMPSDQPVEPEPPHDSTSPA